MIKPNKFRLAILKIKYWIRSTSRSLSRKIAKAFNPFWITPYTLWAGETPIAKRHLVVGRYYRGRCRNASVARWDGSKFHHWRCKFSARFIESINHPEDDNGFDCFTPIMLMSGVDSKDQEIEFHLHENGKKIIVSGDRGSDILSLFCGTECPDCSKESSFGSSNKQDSNCKTMTITTS